MFEFRRNGVLCMLRVVDNKEEQTERQDNKLHIVSDSNGLGYI